MGLVTALLLAAAPALTPPVESTPAAPASRTAETALSVGLGQLRQNGAVGMGLSVARGAAVDAPAPGKARLVYRLEIHTTESGFPRWIEARLSLTEGKTTASSLATPVRSDGPFVAALACVLRWLQPRDQHVFTFIGTSGDPATTQRPDAGTPARLTLGWGVEF